MIRMDCGVFGVICCSKYRLINDYLLSLDIYCSKYRLFLEQLGYDRFRGERLSLDQLMGQRP